ncbi:glycerol dehydrogenase [Neisseria sp. Ec49-e6-T10]|uniref:glycerol dehydrogenase n=1 Tax=Neisseria sp. Ec49-e6-T10 TaxID=3140744 RepID=UPI003EBC5A83
MLTAAIFPGRYLQGSGAIHTLGDELGKLAKNAILLVDPFVDDNLGSVILASCEGKVHTYKIRFAGECCDAEIERVIKEVEQSRFQADIVVGIGGGKTIDTTRAFAAQLNLPTAIVSTLAATDAPCSSVSVVYTPEGEFERVLISKNPLLVLVDSQIVANAPVRYLVSGMGDALATWFEAEECGINYAPTIAGTPPTKTALVLARLCYDTLLEFGVAALEACEQKVVTPALDRIIEANTLLSGLGFESGGLAGAHSIHDAFTILEPAHAMLHGEKVAFGTLCLLMLTGRSTEQIDEVYSFCESVGLPTTLADINLPNVTDEQLQAVAKSACTEGYDIYHLSRPFTWEDVYAAIKAADMMGKRRKEQCCCIE